MMKCLKLLSKIVGLCRLMSSYLYTADPLRHTFPLLPIHRLKLFEMGRRPTREATV